MSNQPSYSIVQIAQALGLEAAGDVSIVVNRLAEPATAGPLDLAMATNPKYADALADGEAQAALLWAGADWKALGLKAAILPERPRHAMSGLTRMYDHAWRVGQGQHATAAIDPSAHVASDAAIGAFSVIEAGAEIGSGAVIGNHVTIGAGVIIGVDATIKDGVRICQNVRIGDRVVIQPGAVVGGDGFSFVTPEASNAETVRASLGSETDAEAQAWARIHSLGGVEIGDDVEVGANTCIDAGSIRATKIGDGTKIDNLCQIGHNVVVGPDCLICGHVGIAGSTTLGHGVVMGGRSAAVDNVIIGDKSVIGANSLVMSNVPAGRAMLGYPATQMSQQIESYKALRRLPRLLRDVAALKKAVSNRDGSD